MRELNRRACRAVQFIRTGNVKRKKLLAQDRRQLDSRGASYVAAAVFIEVQENGINGVEAGARHDADIRSCAAGGHGRWIRAACRQPVLLGLQEPSRWLARAADRYGRGTAP